jgi:hypothetical protein
MNDLGIIRSIYLKTTQLDPWLRRGVELGRYCFRNSKATSKYLGTFLSPSRRTL